MEHVTMENVIDIVPKAIGGYFLFMLPFFFTSSPSSRSNKVLSLIALSLAAGYYFKREVLFGAFSNIKDLAFAHPGYATAFILTLKYLQQKLRYSRLNAIKAKYGFTDNPMTWEDMSIPTAQEIENNIAEYEFPRLYMFGWMSDYVRTATDPGVSRALIRSGHMVNPDVMIEHDRLQTTVHLMSAFLTYPLKSPHHSLAVARINEHHHRYGTMISSDDILYLIIHFCFTPIDFIQRWGYRKLEPFEVHATWVLWRELGCRMGVKYLPKTVEQAREWRHKFEATCRWREDQNEIAAMAMFNEIIWSVPTILKPLARKIVTSIFDWDIVYFCQLEKCGPSPLIRRACFDLFNIIAFMIREFGLPRLSPYVRAPPVPDEKGLWAFGHFPYDTLPFYQGQSFWNSWGYGAVLRKVRGIPTPSKKFFGDGVKIEAMGAPQGTPQAQAAVEQKVRERAAILEKAPFGYRSAVGYQMGRLIGPVDGPSYGSSENSYLEGTPILPHNAHRFDKKYEHRSPGFSKVHDLDTPEDIMHFDAAEAKGINGALPVKVSA